ncbi:MAG: hypothetical protein GY928_30785 [Colwellia sp.]|nr:hypothetical protein [Colwellia sp.]
METNDFKTYLTSASYYAVKIAEDFVKNKLHYDFRYHVFLNQSFDGHASDENDLYPEDNDKELLNLEANDVAKILCRNNKIPEWIDISVEGTGKDFTLLRLYCCGRFTAEREKLYYFDRGQGPFGIKSPSLPLGYIEGKKFKVPKVQQAHEANHQ